MSMFNRVKLIKIRCYRIAKVLVKQLHTVQYVLSFFENINISITFENIYISQCPINTLIIKNIVNQLNLIVIKLFKNISGNLKFDFMLQYSVYITFSKIELNKMCRIAIFQVRSFNTAEINCRFL